MNRGPLARLLRRRTVESRAARRSAQSAAAALLAAETQAERLAGLRAGIVVPRGVQPACTVAQHGAACARLDRIEAAAQARIAALTRQADDAAAAARLTQQQADAVAEVCARQAIDAAVKAERRETEALSTLARPLLLSD
jgi:hypothetical protein